MFRKQELNQLNFKGKKLSRNLQKNIRIKKYLFKLIDRILKQYYPVKSSLSIIPIIATRGIRTGMILPRTLKVYPFKNRYYQDSMCLLI